MGGAGRGDLIMRVYVHVLICTYVGTYRNLSFVTRGGHANKHRT